MKKLDRQALLADRASVMSILTSLPDDDPIGRISFAARLQEIDERLAAIDNQQETGGSVALLFYGAPVHGSRSINAEFASNALGNFQELIAKKVASDEHGELGERGPVRARSLSHLAIRDIVRGSVGFLLEEDGGTVDIIESPMRKAIDDVTRIIEKTASESLDEFESAIEHVDHRFLLSLRGFFKTLDEGDAFIKIVEDDHEATLDLPAIRRGRQRVETIEIDEQETDAVVGQLLGLLPESKKFEMRLKDSGELIKGNVASAFSRKYLEMIADPDSNIINRTWRAKMKIREIRERNKPPRRLYTLLSLIEEIV